MLGTNILNFFLDFPNRKSGILKHNRILVCVALGLRGEGGYDVDRLAAYKSFSFNLNQEKERRKKKVVSKLKKGSFCVFACVSW